MKQMPPDIKHIILADISVKLYNWMLTFCQPVLQQILGEVVVLIQAPP